jgi:hypothetical protein
VVGSRPGGPPADRLRQLADPAHRAALAPTDEDRDGDA